MSANLKVAQDKWEHAWRGFAPGIWRDRVNTPALISDKNWTWRLPWPVEDLACDPQAQERAAFARRLAAKYGR